MGAGETENHSLGGGRCHMDSSGGCRIGGLHPWLVGHLLRPGPRLSRELAGGPLCHRTALEQSLRASTHRPVGGAAAGHGGPLLLVWAPYYCPPQAPVTCTQTGWPYNDPCSSCTTHQLLSNISQGGKKMCVSGQQGAPGGQHNGSFLLPRLSIHLGSHKSLPFSTLTQ